MTWTENNHVTNMQEKEGWYELSPIRELLNMEAADGKQRATDAADTETLLRIIQSVPFPKAEPVKQWLTRFVAHYDQIPEARWLEVCSWLTACLDAAEKRRKR